MSPLQAGIATVDITPYVGIWLAGFAGRKKPSEGVHDPLRSRALVLDDGEKRLCLITNDMLSINYETADEIKAAVQAECGLPPECVMINHSHTHSGPTARKGVSAVGHKPDDCYMEVYVRKLVSAVMLAQQNLQPARLGYARTPVQIGINRRERTANGGTRIGRNPDLPVAPYVDVYRIDSESGTPRAVLFTHACHAVTRAADNYFISADYPGRAQAVVETVFPGAQAVFAQGCAGNINSEPVGGSFEDVWRLGTILGGAVVQAAATCRPESEVKLGSALRSVQVPLQDPPPLEEARAQHEAAETRLRAIEEEGDPTQIRIQQGTVNWTGRVLKLAEDGAKNLGMRYDIQAFALKDAVIVGLAGEVFVEYQLNIAKASPFGFTSVLGVTNGCPAYIPTAAEMPFGGYEVQDSMRFYGTTQLAPACEQTILDAAAGVLQELKS